MGPPDFWQTSSGAYGDGAWQAVQPKQAMAGLTLPSLGLFVSKSSPDLKAHGLTKAQPGLSSGNLLAPLKTTSSKFHGTAPKARVVQADFVPRQRFSDDKKGRANDPFQDVWGGDMADDPFDGMWGQGPKIAIAREVPASVPDDPFPGMWDDAGDPFEEMWGGGAKLPPARQDVSAKQRKQPKPLALEDSPKQRLRVPQQQRNPMEDMPRQGVDPEACTGTFKPQNPNGSFTMGNLMKRFPNSSPQEVAAALEVAGGQADRAVQALQQAALQPKAQVTQSIRAHRKDPEKKVPKRESSVEKVQTVDWSSADPSKWQFNTKEFDGSYSMGSFDPPPIVEVRNPITKGIKKMKGQPSKYRGLFYQSNMSDFPQKDQKFNFVERSKGSITMPTVPNGGFTWMEALYQHLPKAREVGMRPDRVTDGMSFQGQGLGNPVCPGRGEGYADVPSISVIGDVDPYDVMQGGVGDCWLLCAMAALAEFPGAIKQLFKNTPDIELMPQASFNMYTITLYDLRTWKPVDYKIDERLCTKPGGNELLGCGPSITGDLWACYLEKACAVHCGGWDNIQGGQCTHAWRMLLGCKDQYTFDEDENGMWSCGGDFNPNTKRWEKTANHRDSGFVGSWPMEWPKVGGGGQLNSKVSSDDMFERMCAWDDANYIIACGSSGKSDKENTDGIVDGHAYTVLACENDVAGTQFDMIKLRNPWGNGEFEKGKWDDDGPFWEKYPEVKEALNPTLDVDDGIFWMEKDEFFKYFKTVYLCAMDMSDFIEQDASQSV